MKSRSVLLLSLTLLLLLSLPASFANTARGQAIVSMASFWHILFDLKLLMQGGFEFFSHNSGDLTKDQEIQRLLLENQLLGNEINYLKELVEEERRMAEEFIEELNLSEISTAALEERQKELALYFNRQMTNIPARVVYRPVNAWNSSLWIDKGEMDNLGLSRQVIAKNSPVVVGKSVVGVVDFVGKNYSRIRLITDSALNLSVRVKRGKWLLAKGELVGIGEVFSRAHRMLLKGVGFNYDFADREGPARDLRTGKPIEKNSNLPAMPLVQGGDLLVTTGMDGVFPPNLHVASVKKILPLKEGDFAYDLEAEPALKDLNSLMLVFVLPPLFELPTPE